MENENTKRNSRKRTSSQNLPNQNVIPHQKTSTSSVTSRSFQSESFESSENIPQPSFVDSTSAKRRVSLTELLNCKTLFKMKSLTISIHCFSSSY